MKKGIKKTVFVGISVLVALFLCYGLLYALSSYFSSAAFKGTIKRAIEKEYHCNVSLGKIEFGFPPVITVRDINFQTQQGQKIVVVLKGKKLRITPNIFAVIRSFGDIKAFVFPAESPLRNNTIKEQTACAVLQSVLRTPFLDAIKRMALIDGEVVLYVDKDELVKLSGLVVDCGIVVGKKPMIDGSISAKSSFVCGMWKTGRISGHLRLNEALFKISDLVIPAYDGKIALDGSVDLEHEKLNATTVTVSNLSCALAYADMVAHPGAVDGRLFGSIVLGPCPLTPGDFVGKGAITLKDVRISDLPLQKSLFVALILPEMSKISFSSITTNIALTSEKIFNTKTIGTGEPLSFTTQGWITIPGSLSQQATCSFSSHFSNKMPPFVRNSLDVAPEGGRSFSVGVRGTFYDPDVKLDRALINRAVNNAMQEVFTGLRKYFRK
jgi:hypothetical protein